MNIERKPVAYGDLRGWIKALHAAGEIREIDAEVDWNIEIGTVMRLAQGTGDGPALLFNTIKDYGANARCRKIFGCGLSSYRRVAMMLGVAPDTHPRDLVKRPARQYYRINQGEATSAASPQTALRSVRIAPASRAADR